MAKSKNELGDYCYVTFMGRKKLSPWRCRVQLNGKRWVEYFDTEQQALDFKTDILTRRTKHYKKEENEYFSLSYLLNEWLDYKKLDLQKSTLGSYFHQFKIFSSLFDKWFHLISEEDVSKCIEYYGTTHCKRVKEALYVLEQINLLAGDKHKYKLDWNPTRIKNRVKVPKNHKKGKSFYTSDEVKLLLETALNSKKRNSIYFYHTYRLGFSIGCRVGELCSLKKKNFNKRDKTLLINSTIQNAGGYLQDSKMTKSKSSRTIQLSAMAIKSIEYLIEESKTEYIVPYYGHSPKFPFTRPYTFVDCLKRFCKLADLPYIGSHGAMRKTFATLIASNSDKPHRDMIASIQEHLGHKSPQMTLHYIQAIDTDLSDELSKLDNLI